MCDITGVHGVLTLTPCKVTRQAYRTHDPYGATTTTLLDGKIFWSTDSTSALPFLRWLSLAPRLLAAGLPAGREG